MLNVLHLIYNWGKGGFESYVHSLIERLHNRECTICVAYSEAVPAPELIEALGIKTFHIPMRSPYDLVAAEKVAALCRELRISAVHTHFIRERYISALSRFFGNKARLIYTSHVVVPKSTTLKLTNRLVNRMEDNIIAVCHAGREQMLTEKLDAGKIVVIHNGVDVGYWRNDAASTIRKELGINDVDFVVTSAGRFTDVKGHGFLIESVKRLKELSSESLPVTHLREVTTFSKAPEMKTFEKATQPKVESASYLAGENRTSKFKVVLVGEGELLEDCRKQAESLGLSGDIIFAGFRTDMKNILHGSSLYVSSSKSEALSMSIIEALASGLPVVATNVGGTSEVVNEQNNCGTLVEYGDVEGFARAIFKFMQDREFYNTIRENAYRTVREKFSLDKMVMETYNLYKTGNR